MNRLEKSKYTVEDFVLDREFRKWVFSPDQNSNDYWGNFLKRNPEQIKSARIAKEILVNLNYFDNNLFEIESKELWNRIKKETDSWKDEELEKGRIIWLNSQSILNKTPYERKVNRWFSQEIRVAAILLITFFLSITVEFFSEKPVAKTELISDLVYDEYFAPPGVKSTLTMQDGSKVMLNSGSSIRFLKNFDLNKREIFLKGEAYFEVAKDSLRPFSVITSDVITTALGTSFNISAYPNEELKVALVEGKVAIDLPSSKETKVYLNEGEGLKINTKSGTFSKGHFDSELVLAWTKKRIVFQKIKWFEAVRILENWYGVKFIFLNKPDPNIVLYGVFQDETLENILEGLSYSARFQYKINKNEVIIKFT